jgi:hypothetical protein
MITTLNIKLFIKHIQKLNHKTLELSDFEQFLDRNPRCNQCFAKKKCMCSMFLRLVDILQKEEPRLITEDIMLVKHVFIEVMKKNMKSSLEIIVHSGAKGYILELNPKSTKHLKLGKELKQNIPERYSVNNNIKVGKTKKGMFVCHFFWT